ncbi:killer cell lectin-like receptor subfamily I member 1 [Ochotona curzoniae]|uniref:killer cell lectin-like receptor subfamily I member 1 n=1 Tax=Ochotona curzoniae TaxID=130825 RepID=UPI001B34EBB8|nr:killer cell lectin-like receptor subfamily I member 1 [Ochotona curzoniae]
MPSNKQDGSKMNKQTVTYSSLKFPKSQRTQRISSNTDAVMSSMEQVHYADLKVHKTSNLQEIKCLTRGNKREPQSAAWPVITGVLGILCMTLLATLGVLLANFFPSKEEQSREIALTPIPSYKNDAFSCDLSSNNWIGFRNSYYHFSQKYKTWPESHAACVELNAHLLMLDSEEEKEILSLLRMNGWIDLKWDETSGCWFQKDGTQVNESGLVPLEKDDYCGYTEGKLIYSDNCSSRKSYVCECNILI